MQVTRLFTSDMTIGGEFIAFGNADSLKTVPQAEAYKAKTGTTWIGLICCFACDTCCDSWKMSACRTNCICAAGANSKNSSHDVFIKAVAVASEARHGLLRASNQ